MAEKQVVAPAPVMESNDVVEKAKDFWSRFSKPIIYAGSAIILIGGGWFAYQNLVVEPKAAKGADAIFPAEQLFSKMSQAGFNKDSINLVLNGGGAGVTTGILKVASTYDGTPAGNRAHFIAGACYLHNGEFDKAVKHLKSFSTDATQIQTAAYSMLGDASAELKKNDEALDYYKKAASVNEKDEFMSAESLYKAAYFAEATGKTKEAIDLYEEINEKYPKNNHLTEIEKSLARLGVVK